MCHLFVSVVGHSCSDLDIDYPMVHSGQPTSRTCERGPSACPSGTGRHEPARRGSDNMPVARGVSGTPGERRTKRWRESVGVQR
eukprot:13699198-Alexandrium_andersonii.AAC.1